MDTSWRWWLLAKVDEDLVSTYFYLQKRIDRAIKRIEEYETEFKWKNFYTSVQMRYEEMTTVAFNLEKEVTNHVSAIEMAEQHIKTLQFKLKHFDRFMNGLSSSDREYYTSRYKYDYEALNDRLDKLIFEEVSEIEEAAAYHHGGLVKTNYQLIELEASPENHFKAMMDQLGVM